MKEQKNRMTNAGDYIPPKNRKPEDPEKAKLILQLGTMITDRYLVKYTRTMKTDDPEFWKGCEGCRHFDILQSHDYKMCICTGLLYDPREHLTIHHPEI